MNKEEINKLEKLHDKVYGETLGFGRTQFVSRIVDLQKENQELKIQVSSREEIANKYKEVIDKAIKILILCNSQCAKETIEILKEAINE